MAGGPSTPALVIAAARAGALGFLAGGYVAAPALAEAMATVRAGTDEAFGVNLFVPGRPTEDPTALAAYLAGLEERAAAAGTALGTARWDDDAYADKVSQLCADPPAIVSFTFGCPSPDVVRTLQRAGALVAVTVTRAGEADLAVAAGADCLCVQGAEAGAHRGSFQNDPERDDDQSVRALLADVGARCALPLIAAGGIAGPQEVEVVMEAGATLAQAGTAFLRSDESGAHPLYKGALADPGFTTTAVTRAFSGRPARALVNGFVSAHPDAPAAYPEINNATRPLRAAATAAGDLQGMSLYAGQGFRRAEARPAGEIVEQLVGARARHRAGGPA
jgi:nitronate monooxygenase